MYFNYFTLIIIFPSCYGKFIQDDLNRLVMNICLEEKQAAHYIASPLFVGMRIINTKTIAVFRQQSMYN